MLSTDIYMQNFWETLLNKDIICTTLHSKDWTLRRAAECIIHFNIWHTRANINNNIFEMIFITSTWMWLWLWLASCNCGCISSREKKLICTTLSLWLFPVTCGWCYILLPALPQYSFSNGFLCPEAGSNPWRARTRSLASLSSTFMIISEIKKKESLSNLIKE